MDAVYPGNLESFARCFAAAGCAALVAHGVATIIDLRGSAEAARMAMCSAEGLERLAFPIEPRDTAPLEALALRGAATPDAMRAWMIAGYRRYVAHKSAAFSEALAAVVERAPRGVLVNCTAGKDRTGFLVASVQHALGVPMADIVADYTLTERLWQPLPARPGVSEQAHRALMAANPAFLAAAFAEAETLHGGFDTFLTDGLGLDTARRARLGLALLEPV